MRAFEKYDRGVAQLVRHSAIALIKEVQHSNSSVHFAKYSVFPSVICAPCALPTKSNWGKQVFS